MPPDALTYGHRNYDPEDTVVYWPGQPEPTRGVHNHRQESVEQTRDLIAQVVPGIGMLQVRTGGDRMRVVFETGTGDLNLKDLGTGVEQLLMTLVVGLTEAPPFTLLIEEPETNLNPAAQRTLLGLLQAGLATG